MKIRDGSQQRYETANLPRSQAPEEQIAPWNEPSFEDEASLDPDDEEEEELFNEPLLQQLFQSWSQPAPQPAYQRAVSNWPAHNRPVQSRPAQNRAVQSAPAQTQPAQNRPAPGPAPAAPQTPEAPRPAATKTETTQPSPRPQSAPSKNTLNLPPRPEGALTGKQFLESTKGMDRKQRESAILKEIQQGNVPDFARQMREIQVNSNGHNGTLRVMPDYLAIGSNDDFVRIPMDPKTAQKIADQTGTSLPTTKMVDDIYKQADTRLTPQPLPPGAQMMSNDYYGRHNNMVEQQMAGRGAEHGLLTAGHQKDLVISNRLTQHPDRVAIYGWHQQNGKPIQGLSTVHENSYADYSHGVRLVGGTMLVDGQERPVSEVLQDPALAGLISNEGALRDPRVPGV